MIKNNLETILKIKSFFEKEGVDSEDILFELNQINSKEKILERYVHRFKNNQLTKLDEKSENKISLDSLKFTIHCNDKTDPEELKDIFGENTTLNIYSDYRYDYFTLEKEKSELLIQNIKILREKIYCKELSSQRNFNWSFENIKQGISADLWDWKEISRNEGIVWNFEFIDLFKDYLDWRFVKVNNSLKWDKTLIDKYSSYIFTCGTVDYDELTFCRGMIDGMRRNFELNENIKWSSSLIDSYADKWDWELLSRNSNIHFTDKLIDKYNDKWNFKQFSGFSNLRISSEIINKYYKKWDFDKLVRNESIKLDFSNIEKMKDDLDWNYITILEHLLWDDKTIDKYSDYIFSKKDFLYNDYYGISLRDYCYENNLSHNFEFNNNIVWTDYLINKYKHKWNWERLMQNDKIEFDEEQLEKYTDYIDWGTFFSQKKINWTGSIFKKYYNDKYIYDLVRNNFLEWDEIQFNKYVKSNIVKNNNILLESFCQCAKISNDLIIKNQTLWSTESSVKHYYRRNSDGSYFAYSKESLWRYLSTNPNIVWNDYLVENCLEKMMLNEMNFSFLQVSVDFINKYWGYYKEENTWHSGNYDSGPYQELEVIHLREYFKNCKILDLTFDDFKKHEFKWLGSPLIDENLIHINESIKELLLRQ